MLTNMKDHLKAIYCKVSSLYTKKKEALDQPDEEDTFSPPPGYIERVDCKEIIGFYLTLKEIDRVPTSMGVIHYGHEGVHVIPAKPNGPIDQQ